MTAAERGGVVGLLQVLAPLVVGLGLYEILRALLNAYFDFVTPLIAPMANSVAIMVSVLLLAPRWGVGGLVADALAAPARRVIVLDGAAPGALPAEPSEAQRLRSFAMYVGARRGRTLAVDPARLSEGLELGLTHILGVAIAAGAMRADTPMATLRRSYEEHAARVLRDHRLVAGASPAGTPLTVVKAANSLAPESAALGWDRFGPVERLGSGGDHYSMLTDSAAAAHLAMLLRRWLAPAFSVA
jgi:hypothetical protein